MFASNPYYPLRRCSRICGQRDQWFALERFQSRLDTFFSFSRFSIKERINLEEFPVVISTFTSSDIENGHFYERQQSQWRRWHQELFLADLESSYDHREYCKTFWPVTYNAVYICKPLLLEGCTIHYLMWKHQ